MSCSTRRPVRGMPVTLEKRHLNQVADSTE
jgi:hypothetical protein